jgi:hypothetical protein
MVMVMVMDVELISSSCDVCTESYNKRTHKQVKCVTCDFSACLSCHERYNTSTNTSVSDPHCMHCKRLWDSEYIVKNMSRATLKRFKTHKEHALIQMERSRIPETQYYLQYDTHVNTTLAKEMDDLIFLLTNLHLIHPSSANRTKQHNITNRRITQIKAIINAWTSRMEMLDTDHIPEPLREQLCRNKSLRERNRCLQFVCPCPKEECNGFVMQSDWKCGVCSNNHCNKCHKHITEVMDHVCKEDDVKTAKFIMETSHACPSCATRIHKISGCDQMWCTHCNTAFSWRTGIIENGAVHNPHFFEWCNDPNRSDRNGRLPLLERQNNCDDGRPPFDHLIRHTTLVPLQDVDRTFIRLMYQLNVHIETVEMGERFRTHERDNMDLRIKWLRKSINERELGSSLHRRYKNIMVNTRRAQVYQLFITLSNDIFHKILHSNTSHECENIITEFHDVIGYVNKCFRHLARVYEMRMPCIELQNIGKLYVSVVTTSTGYIKMCQ